MAGGSWTSSDNSKDFLELPIDQHGRQAGEEGQRERMGVYLQPVAPDGFQDRLRKIRMDIYPRLE